jgi:hypothetical protein
MPRPPSPSGLSSSAIRPATSGVFAGLLADFRIRPDELVDDLRVSPPPEVALLLAWPLFAKALALMHDLALFDSLLAFLILPVLATAARIEDRWTQAMLLCALGLPGPMLLLL